MKKQKGVQAPNPKTHRRRYNYGGPKTLITHVFGVLPIQHEYVLFATISEEEWKQKKSLLKGDLKHLLNLDVIQTILVPKGQKFLKQIWVRMDQLMGFISQLEDLFKKQFSFNGCERTMFAKSA